MDRALAQGASADEAEEIALTQLRALGADLLTDWDRTRHDQSVAAARAEQPHASKDAKKKLKWFTTFGPIQIEEQLLRRGRRGANCGPSRSARASSTAVIPAGSSARSPTLAPRVPLPARRGACANMTASTCR